MSRNSRKTSLRALVLGAAMLGCGRSSPTSPPVGAADSSAATNLGPVAATDTVGAVQAEMRHVDFHFEAGLVLRIDWLDGELIPTRRDRPVTFDEKRSFTLRIRSAHIAIDTASLDILLNRHVFGYRASPLRNLRVTTEGDQLVQRGTLKKGLPISFTIRSTVSLTDEGWIRLHPVSVKALGINVRGLLKFLGAHLDGLIQLEDGHGARVQGDDFLLDPAAMLPPPRVRGRLTAIKVEPGRLVQTFGVTAARPTAPEPNYMWFRGGILRFGKLTMTDTDLKIIDEDPTNVFDFFLDRYNEQLVAGQANNTRSFGLVVHMPDFRSLPRRTHLRQPLDSQR